MSSNKHRVKVMLHKMYKREICVEKNECNWQFISTDVMGFL
jgi:hypothetical protein